MLCSFKEAVLLSVMSQNIDIWITSLWSNPFIPLSRRSRMKRNKEISWFLTKDFHCKLWSCEWSKMYISGWQHMSSCTVLYYFPVILCHDYGRLLSVSLAFSILLQDSKTRPLETFAAMAPAGLASRSIPQSAPAVPPSLAAAGTTTTSHLPPNAHAVIALLLFSPIYIHSSLKNPHN